MHDGRPAALDVGSVWDNVSCLDNGESGFIRRLLSHPPEKSTFGVRRMTADVKRPFLGIQTGDDLETRLVDGTFRLLGVLQGNADLITQLWVLVSLEIFYWLSKIVLDEVEEGAVVLLLHPRVPHNEGTVCDDRRGRLIERELTLDVGYFRRGTL